MLRAAQDKLSRQAVRQTELVQGHIPAPPASLPHPDRQELPGFVDETRLYLPTGRVARASLDNTISQGVHWQERVVNDK